MPHAAGQEEVCSILDEPMTLSHQTVFSVLYCEGFRRSELLALYPTYLDDAPATGKLVSELEEGTQTTNLLEAFDPERFR